MTIKRLRQGDHLSPYLFILVADVMSRVLETQVDRGNIQGIRPRAGCPEVQHLFFADDSIFFMRGSVEKARHLRGLIDQYCCMSG